MTTLVRVVAAIVFAVAAAALIFALSHGHVLFFPLILLLGVPLWWSVRPPRSG